MGQEEEGVAVPIKRRGEEMEGGMVKRNLIIGMVLRMQNQNEVVDVEMVTMDVEMVTVDVVEVVEEEAVHRHGRSCQRRIPKKISKLKNFAANRSNRATSPPPSQPLPINQVTSMPPLPSSQPSIHNCTIGNDSNRREMCRA